MCVAELVHQELADFVESTAPKDILLSLVAAYVLQTLVTMPA